MNVLKRIEGKYEKTAQRERERDTKTSFERADWNSLPALPSTPLSLAQDFAVAANGVGSGVPTRPTIKFLHDLWIFSHINYIMFLSSRGAGASRNVRRVHPREDDASRWFFFAVAT